MAIHRSKISWLPGAATALAIVSCYGTALLTGLLSMLGVSMVINEGAWAGAISLFAGLAVAFIGASGRRQRIFGPTVISTAGLAFILWAMYGAYSRIVEFVGFALLVTATLWDLRLRRVRRYAECDLPVKAAETSGSSGTMSLRRHADTHADGRPV
ncbi:MAG: MerC domain-containing protein [Gemmataceae bacterium]